MKDIIIDSVVADKTKQLKIEFTSQSTGQIRMDRYYHGQAIYSQNEWRVYLADKSELNNSGDIEALIQILSERKE